MHWRIEITDRAQKSIDKLDKPVSERINAFLERLLERENPRLLGGSLSGTLAGRWKYRVGDYRLICEIQDEVLIVLVLEVGHRSKVYKD